MRMSASKASDATVANQRATHLSRLVPGRDDEQKTRADGRLKDTLQSSHDHELRELGGRGRGRASVSVRVAAVAFNAVQSLADSHYDKPRRNQQSLPR